MRATVDVSELRQLDRDLQRAGRAFDERAQGQALRLAGRPMLKQARIEVPVGKRKRTGKGRLARDGAGDGTYDRGGATKRDLRLKIVKNTLGQPTLIVGVDKRRGHTGWRTKFTTRGTSHNSANDFLGRTESKRINVVISSFGQAAQEIVLRTLRRYDR